MLNRCAPQEEKKKKEKSQSPRGALSFPFTV